MDLSLVGGTFTWLNNGDSPSWSRIGKPNFLVCPRRGFLDFAQIISRSSLTMATFKGVVGTSNLKTCG